MDLEAERKGTDGGIIRVRMSVSGFDRDSKPISPLNPHHPCFQECGRRGGRRRQVKQAKNWGYLCCVPPLRLTTLWTVEEWQSVSTVRMCMCKGGAYIILQQPLHLRDKSTKKA